MAFPQQAWGQIQVDFVPSALDLEPGESALVAVRAADAPLPGLAALHLDITFDPTGLDLLNPNEAFRESVPPFAPLGNNPLCTTVRGTATCDDPDWLLTSTGRLPVGIDTIDNIGGHVLFAYGTSGLQTPPIGSGVIGFVEVVGGSVGTHVVDISGMILADKQEPPAAFDAVATPLTVTVSICNDSDEDGYGAPGAPSCPGGSELDCNDANPDVNPGMPERCRNGIDDDCDGSTDGEQTECLAPICALAVLGAPGSAPVLTMLRHTSCPPPSQLDRAVDWVWGDLATVQIVGSEVRLGAVNQIACGVTESIQQFDTLKPESGFVDFVLVRETGTADYGTDHSGRPRIVDSGDCPP
jgi:hypothetical protein